MWYISDPANPQTPASGRRYARALTSNADVRLTLAELAYDGHDEYAGLGIQQISWNRKDYEYVAAVHWSAGHEPLLLVQNRRQTRDQVLSVHLGSEASVARSGRSTTVLEEHANDQCSTSSRARRPSRWTDAWSARSTTWTPTPTG